MLSTPRTPFWHLARFVALALAWTGVFALVRAVLGLPVWVESVWPWRGQAEVVALLLLAILMTALLTAFGLFWGWASRPAPRPPGASREGRRGRAAGALDPKPEPTARP